MGQFHPELEEEVISDPGEEIEEPPMYRVLLINDNYTTMEFVVEILMHVFKKPVEDATRIMLAVHQQGSGLCGVYPYEIAETKVDTVHTLAREHGYPLKCTMEEDAP